MAGMAQGQWGQRRHGGYGTGMADTHDAHPMPAGIFADLPRITPAAPQPVPAALDDLKPIRRRMQGGSLPCRGSG